MSATITIGWWVVPLAVTVIAFGWAMWRSSKVTRGSSGGFLPDMSVLEDLFYFVPAIVVSLLAWLIWAVLT